MMEKAIRPLFDTAAQAAREQTALMVSEFARDMMISIGQFGLAATREAIPAMIGGPEDLVNGVLERLGNAEGDAARERVARYLADNLTRLWWYQEQLDLAVTDLVRHGTIMMGDDLQQVMVASVPGDIRTPFFRSDVPPPVPTR